MLQNTVELDSNIMKGTEYSVSFRDIQRSMLAVVYLHFGTAYRSHFSEDGTDRLYRYVDNKYQHMLRNHPQDRRPHKATEFRNYNNENELRIVCDDVKCTELKKISTGSLS